MRFKPFCKLSFKTLLLLLVIFSLGIVIGQKIIPDTQNKPVLSVSERKNMFISEIYDKVKENYWDNITDTQLLDLFKLSIDRNSGTGTIAKLENKDKLLDLIGKTTSSMNDEQKNQFITSVVSSVLVSLNPAGRSGLYTQKNEEQLKNTVENINPEKDLYKDLGLAKGASETAVADAFKAQAEKLAQDKSPEAQEKLKRIAYAKDTLTKKDSKERYDQKGIEPTIFTKTLGFGILYVQFKKFSPTSLDEFQKAFESYKETPGLNALIFDLRGNIGGAIDATAYFLGYFLGKNQYAFDFYHKGEYLPFKTPTDKMPSLLKYKQIAILIDNQTQSSAEMMAAALKKYHIGVIVGVPTKGWGTVERVFPLDNQISQKEKYSLFLVHSITIRDDNLPIEGRGVEPDVSVKDPNWQDQLFPYFKNPNLVSAVKDIITSSKP